MTQAHRNGGDRKTIVSWAFYDWANSAFATTVMAGFFPVFFKEYWSPGVDATVSTFRLGLITFIASLMTALVAPVLGTIADVGGTRKRHLAVFAAAGIVFTASFYFVPQGHWALASAAAILATFGFAGANIFYDAMLVDVAGKDRRDRVSAFGYALGYLGGGVLFAGNVAMMLWPGVFGLADQAAAIRVSFVTVAVWWAIFSIPLLRHVRETRKPDAGGYRTAVRQGFRQLAETARQIGRYRNIVLFLVAYWFYIDGVHTIIRMATDFGLSLGFGAQELLKALLITQFVGFPSALLFGRLAGPLGAKRGILLGLGVYVAVSIWGAMMDSEWEFYVLAIGVGLVQGGVQALSRSFFASIIPDDKAGEFFGFYNLFGRFAAVLGPLLMGGVGLLTGNPRFSVLAVVLLIAVGGFLLSRVRETEPSI